MYLFCLFPVIFVYDILKELHAINKSLYKIISLFMYI